MKAYDDMSHAKVGNVGKSGASCNLSPSSSVRKQMLHSTASYNKKGNFSSRKRKFKDREKEVRPHTHKLFVRAREAAKSRD